MTMRGYCVLLVCALCVFVLCGAAAAAVVAQDVTPEKTAREAKVVADVAKAKGYKALGIQKEFAGDMSIVMWSLTMAIDKIAGSSRTAGGIKKGLPTSTEAEKIIGELKTKVDDARTAVTALEGAATVKFKEEHKKTALTIIMKEVEDNMKEMAEKAAAIYTDEVSAIPAAIKKASELEAVAEKAGLLWHVAMGDLTTQLACVRAAFMAVNTTKNKTETVLKNTENSEDTGARNVRDELLSVVEGMLEPSLETLMLLEDETQDAREAAYFASQDTTHWRRRRGSSKGQRGAGGKGEKT